MQIVIDIPDRIYKIIQSKRLNLIDIDVLEQAVKDGTPLPKIHEMREATPEELESVNNYIKSISKPTGVNIWDKIEEVRANSDNYDYSTHSYRKGCRYSDRTERSGEDADSN